jgi:hypothetical protein
MVTLKLLCVDALTAGEVASPFAQPSIEVKQLIATAVMACGARICPFLMGLNLFAWDSDRLPNGVGTSTPGYARGINEPRIGVDAQCTSRSKREC